MIDEKKLIAEIREYIDEYKELDMQGVINLKWCAMMDVLELVESQPKVGEWISIDDRLPTLGTWNIVTIKNHLMGGRKELRYPVIYMEKMYDVGYGFYENGTDILMPEYSEITAWQPLPEPWEGEEK